MLPLLVGSLVSKKYMKEKPVLNLTKNVFWIVHVEFRNVYFWWWWEGVGAGGQAVLFALTWSKRYVVQIWVEDGQLDFIPVFRRSFDFFSIYGQL